MAKSRKKFSLSLVFRISRTVSKYPNRTDKNKTNIPMPMYKYSPNLHQMPIYRSEIPAFWKGFSVEGKQTESHEKLFLFEKIRKKAEFITRLSLVWVLSISEFIRHREKDNKNSVIPV